MNCQQCGTALLNNEIICSNCGFTTDLEKLDTVVEQPPPLEPVIAEPEEEVQAEKLPVKNKRKKIMVIAGLVLLSIVIAAGSYLAWNAYQHKKESALAAVLKIQQEKEEQAQALLEQEEEARIAAEAEEAERIAEETRAFEESVALEQKRLLQKKQQLAEAKKALPENCVDQQACMSSMLSSATKLDLHSVEIAASRMSSMSKVRPGDIGAAWGLNQQGIAEAKDKNNLQAIKLFRQALNADPASMAIHLNLVDTLFEENLIDEAHKALMHIISINPRLTYAWRQLARCYADKNQTEMAVNALVIGYQFAPDKRGMLLQYENVTQQSQVGINLRIIYLSAIKKIRTL
jgi:tetratricopeptide (TPR) repeat protein